MEHPPPSPLHQDTMFPIVIFFKWKTNWTQYKKNGTLLYYNITINNIYLDGSNIISVFHQFNAGCTMIGRSVKPVKEEY